MNHPFSVYLDLVRFSAAVLVYLWHSNQRFLTESILPASNYGHSSVIVFFVLSGFVIAFITDTKESTLSTYAASRMSRVFSVAVPAIVITLVLDSAGRILYPAIYAYPYDQFLSRIAGSLLMANEVWMISITSFSNVPYWSICYEWWYYVTFAMVMFLPTRRGLLIAAATMLVIGPKLILLAPVWWMGVLLYRWRSLQQLSLTTSGVMVAFSVFGIVLFHQFAMMGVSETWLESLIGSELVRSLTFSKRFIADYVLSILVFVNFAGMRNLVAFKGGLMLAIARPVRFLANYTFTLYLLHQPLFLFWAAVIRGDPKAPWYWASVTVLTMLSVGLIGFYTESRRHVLRAWMLPYFRRWETARATAFSQVARAQAGPNKVAD
jgi:peptidoglycan/LPS O-acetylase OafA/YrhL